MSESWPPTPKLFTFGQANNDDDDEQYVGGMLNVAPSSTAETEHVQWGIHEILQCPLHNNQNIINVPVLQGPALSETLENVDGLINLLKKIVSIEVPIAILPSIEDDLGFPWNCKDVWDNCEMMDKEGDSLIPITQSSPIRC